MKVKVTNRKLLKRFLSFALAFGGLLQFFSFLDFDKEQRIQLQICILSFLFFVYLFMLYRANNQKELKIVVNQTDIRIKFGDLFSQSGIKVIAFNEYFDTTVDDKIIARNSLNGKYITDYTNGPDYVDKVIENEDRIDNQIKKKNVKRQYGGKKTQYELGTICPNEDFFLLAFTHFDEDNRAYLTLEEYITCLVRMWNEIDKFYNGRTISIPLLGSGITRLSITPQEMLEYIITTFRICKLKFNNTSSLTIVLSDNLREKINLYDIKGTKS